jgi:hypothetical protein
LSRSPFILVVGALAALLAFTRCTDRPDPGGDGTACQSSDAGEDLPDAGPPDASYPPPWFRDGGYGSAGAEAFCQSYLEALCGRYVRCGIAAGQDACVRSGAWFIVEYCLDHLGPGEDQGVIRFDEAAAEVCLSQIENASACTNDDNILAEFRTCSDAIQGQVAPGEPCLSSAECAAPHYCTAQTCPGTCTPLAQQGQWPLAFDGCANGLVFDWGTGTCELPAGTGEDCGDAFDQLRACVAGYFCDHGTCTPRKALGEPCTGTHECEIALRCTGTCEPLGSVGDACTGHDCLYDLRCESEELLGSGICTASKSQGQSCWMDYECDEALICVGSKLDVKGTCEIPKEVGQDCTGNDPCADGLYCDATEACAPQREGGAPCDSEFACLSYRCFDGACEPRSACPSH